VADDTGYQPSPLGGAAPAPTTALPIVKPAASTGAYSPSDIKAALINAGATAPVATTLTAISGAESNFGKSPVSPPNHNGSRDYGVFQINDAAHPQYGGSAVASLPLSQQAKYALEIYNRENFKAWTTYSSGAYKAHLGQVDSTTPTGAPLPPGAAPPSTPAQPANVGTALAALSMPTGGTGTKSTMDNLQSMAGGGGGGGDSAPPPMNLENQQSAAQGGIMRQQMLAQQGAQLAAALRAKGGLPPVPGPSSTQTFMGGQMMPMANPAPTPGAPQAPGTTLNSTGLYG
jgi:hypothetical protein